MEVGGFKWNWLLAHLVEFTASGSVLLFVTKKQNCDELTHNLHLKEVVDCRAIHGDMHQSERNEIITAFKRRDFPVLVATDVAARGLDIPHIRTVINFDVARDIDTHTHRVGRTGRAGAKGTAYTLVTEKDKEFAGHLVRNLEAANQEVPKDLMDLAMKSAWFKSSRFKRGRGKAMAARPGLGHGGNDNAPPAESEQYTYGDSSAPSSSGGTGNRLLTMKSAFKAQYMSKFKRATGEDHPAYAGGVTASMQQQQMPPPPGLPNEEGQKAGEKKRKSRWE
jgi:ATP-dependent RNA helicase DDX42